MKKLAGELCSLGISKKMKKHTKYVLIVYVIGKASGQQ